MTREELLMWLQRHYGIRHCMVEGGYITPKDFCEEVLQVIETKGGIQFESTQEEET